MKKTTVALITFLAGIAAGVAYGYRPPTEIRLGERRSDPALRHLHSAHPEEALEAEAAAVEQGNKIVQEIGKNLKVDSIPHWDDDLTVTNRVRTNLGKDTLTSQLSRFNIDTFHGMCTVHGHADSFNQYKSVQRVVAETNGVKNVRMHVSVGDVPAHSI